MSSIESIYADKEHGSYFSTVRTEVTRVLQEPVSRVLEIGCGDGATLAYLKESGLAEWTCGVDIHNESLQAAKARGIDAAVHGDVEELLTREDLSKFDAILCMDVLEHLVDPWAAVKQLSSLLVPGGALIASIPNVQNMRVVAPLLVGRWQYRDCGILDNGHLRFFTKKTAIDLVESGGLRATQVQAIYEKHWLPRVGNVVTLGVFSRFVTVQYLIRAVREPD